MKETFDEYKKTLELNLMNISFLYSGDVISSVNSSYSEVINNSSISPSFIIKCIIKIYEESFDIMSKRSKEIIISKESIEKFNFIKALNSKIKDLSIAYAFVGYGEKIEKPSRTAFPEYFYENRSIIYDLGYLSSNPKIFYTPLIKDEDEEIIYISDNPIQSLVYSIQNMEYKIIPIDKFGWKHLINYNIYKCKFISYKILIRNTSKIRDDKINRILNDDRFV